LMDFHHDTSLRSILKDDSISSTSKAHICSCSSKGAKLWLVVRSSMHSFHIAHSIFILALHFHLNFIQPLTYSLLMCECAHKLNTFSTHLSHYPFGGQWIITHNTIGSVIYAFA
jgi:hypothetical protein